MRLAVLGQACGSRRTDALIERGYELDVFIKESAGVPYDGWNHLDVKDIAEYQPANTPAINAMPAGVGLKPPPMESCLTGLDRLASGG